MYESIIGHPVRQWSRLGTVPQVSIQSTSIKEQSSISHTPEGTDTESARLKGVERNTISKVHDASERSIDLCTTPVGRGGKFFRDSLISKL